MMNRSAFGVVLAFTIIAVAATGCAGNDDKPTSTESAVTRSEGATATASSQSPAATTMSETASATPTGQPIGNATMKVSGAGQATIRYQINGGVEQTESNVALPWEKQYPVYNEIQSSVTADAGDAELICSIIMDGKLAAFQTEPTAHVQFRLLRPADHTASVEDP
jgi:hypothetical protein